jgi:hypothetical protein
VSPAGRTRLLIISFSGIASDARVLKQVTEFAARYEVTTCGYGPAPEGVSQHIEIPSEMSYQDISGRLITLRQYERAYRAISAVRFASNALAGSTFDVILANEPETVGVALGLEPAGGVHVDLHEYTPRLHEEIESWRRRLGPFYSWMCRKYVARGDSWTTVGDGLAREYQREFGFRPEVVTNATPYRDDAVGPVRSPIRLVHSGACLRDRHLDAMIEGIARSQGRFSLDFYLTPNDPGYLDELRQRADQVPLVSVREPVPYAELHDTIRAYDIGVHLLPPTNFNNLWALPNKFFDYVQARLGVLVGPSAEMAEYVRRYGVGWVSTDFTADAMAATLDSLDSDAVATAKAASASAAHDLSAGPQVAVWARAVARLAERATTR